MAATDLSTREPWRQLLRALWLGLAIVVGLRGAEVAGDSADDGLAENARPEQVVPVADPTVYRWVFGKGLTKLKVLWLEKTRVTDEGLAYLKGLTDLYFLMLAQTKVTDSGLAHLSELKKLEVLWLADTRVTDAGLVQLQGLPNLSDLRLGGTRVSDAGLAHLKGKTSLNILTLDNTKVTGAGIADLQSSLPRLTVSTSTTALGASSRNIP